MEKCARKILTKIICMEKLRQAMQALSLELYEAPNLGKTPKRSIVVNASKTETAGKYLLLLLTH